MHALLALVLFTGDYTGNRALALEAGFNLGFHLIGVGGDLGRNAPSVEGRVGLRLAQPVAIEFGLGFLPSGFGALSKQLAMNPHMDMTYDFLQESIRPYIGGGIGGVFFVAGEAGTPHPLAEGHAFVGLKIGLVDRMALRIEARALGHAGVFENGRAWPSYVSGIFSIGLMWGAGGRDPLEVVVEKKSIEVVQIDVDHVFLAQHARFDSGTATIDPEYAKALDQLAAFMTQHPEIKKLGIHGHTDSEGTRAKNQDLSEKRAQAVVDYLVGKGVGADRLEAKGYGQDKPLASNKSALGKERNRRVDFVILQKD